MAFSRKPTILALAVACLASSLPATPSFDAIAPLTIREPIVLPAKDFTPSLGLAISLFNDGDLARASIEAKRAIASTATNGPVHGEAVLLDGLAAYLRGSAALPDPPPWQAEGLSERQRIAVAYAIGVSSRSGTEIEKTRLPALRYVFDHTDETALFWNASSLLYFTLKEDKALRESEADLGKLLLTCRNAWPVEVVRASKAEAKTAGEGPADAPLPLRLFIRTYRSQISPAIGSRCLLEPSCSEFYLRACRKHGWIGMGIGGDRLIREPTVTGDPERAIVMPSGLIRYADPVSEHDYWLEAPSQ